MIISPKPERGAASFVSNFLITGSEESVRRCLRAYDAGKTLAANERFKRAAEHLPAGSRFNIVTYTDDRESARLIFSRLARQNSTNVPPAGAERSEEWLDADSYSITLTELVDNGFMRQTFSGFGQFGKLVGEIPLKPDVSPSSELRITAG